MGLARIIGAGSSALKSKVVAWLNSNLSGVTAMSDSDDEIMNAIYEVCEAYRTNGAATVTLSSSVSGRTVTTKASNGRTSSASVALGTDSGSTTFTLTPSGNNTATKSMVAGYYNAGTVTADGTTAYNAGYSAGKAAGGFSGYERVSTSTSYTATSDGYYVCLRMTIKSSVPGNTVTTTGTEIMSTNSLINYDSKYAHSRVFIAKLTTGQVIKATDGEDHASIGIYKLLS